VFSESDKRALALAVFMAKINCMDSDEKLKSILVLDDPATSFDDNRIKSVICKIMQLSQEMEQTFIMAHHFMFAQMFFKSNDQQIEFYKLDYINGANDNNGIFEMNAQEAFASEFGRAFNKIDRFNKCQINDISENDLRIFLEEYLAITFAKQYAEKNLKSKKFGERIDELFNTALISNDVKQVLHQYREQLNPGSHTFTEANVEDVRNFSNELINYVFEKVKIY